MTRAWEGMLNWTCTACAWGTVSSDSKWESNIGKLLGAWICLYLSPPAMIIIDLGLLKSNISRVSSFFLDGRCSLPRPLFSPLLWLVAMIGALAVGCYRISCFETKIPIQTNPFLTKFLDTYYLPSPMATHSGRPSVLPAVTPHELPFPLMERGFVPFSLFPTLVSLYMVPLSILSRVLLDPREGPLLNDFDWPWWRSWPWLPSSMPASTLVVVVGHHYIWSPWISFDLPLSSSDLDQMILSWSNQPKPSCCWANPCSNFSSYFSIIVMIFYRFSI